MLNRWCGVQSIKSLPVNDVLDVVMDTLVIPLAVWLDVKCNLWRWVNKNEWKPAYLFGLHASQSCHKKCCNQQAQLNLSIDLTSPVGNPGECSHLEGWQGQGCADPLRLLFVPNRSLGSRQRGSSPLWYSHYITVTANYTWLDSTHCPSLSFHTDLIPPNQVGSAHRTWLVFWYWVALYAYSKAELWMNVHSTKIYYLMMKGFETLVYL